MKIINHKRNNFFYDESGSVMRGTIKMTKEEFDDVFEYLKKRYKKLTPHFYGTMVSRMGGHYGKNNNLVSPGLTPCYVLAERYGLKLKNDRNYQIEIIK